MNSTDFSGFTEIDNSGIKKHFKNIDPWKAIFELVWNGFDANADRISISISENGLEKAEVISVLDNGDGIDFRNAKSNFGKFNDSIKKGDAAQHGLHGRGRLAFHRLCQRATWYTKSKAGEAKIVVSSDNIKHYSGVEIAQDEQIPLLKKSPKGTCVELTGINQNLPTNDNLRNFLSTEFGWYLALNPSKKLFLQNNEILIPENRILETEIEIEMYKFKVSIIRWLTKPSSEKSYVYLLNSSQKTEYKQLSRFNNKPNFYISTYIESSWADNFTAGNGDLLTEGKHTTNSSEWRNLVRQINSLTGNIYSDFLREFVDLEIEQYVKDGIFPAYENPESEYSIWRLNHTKMVVKSIYTADPKLIDSLNKKQKKLLIRLLDKILISNENDSIFEILNSVLDLDDETSKALADQLKTTTLENIVSTIEILKQRQTAANQIRELMNVHYKNVLETPDLQKIIENNTWLFGHRYETLGAEEDSFTKVAKALRSNIKLVDEITPDDIDDETSIDGAKRQSDLFLARKIPTFDSFGNQIFRCVIIEIKRPSISLNIKHLRQLDDYAAIIKGHAEFSSEKIQFELILIGRKISSSDTEIESRMKGQISKGEMGLVSDDPRMKRYVLNWYTILDSFELSNNFMLARLKLKRDDLSNYSKNELVSDLQNKVTQESHLHIEPLLT